jgi:hypothetical protein
MILEIDSKRWKAQSFCHEAAKTLSFEVEKIPWFCSIKCVI